MRRDVGMRHVGFGPASEWYWVPPADMASAEGDTAPKSVLPDMPETIAENAENVNISGLADSPPAAEYAENGEDESYPLTSTPLTSITTTTAGKNPNSAYSAQVTEAAVEREVGE
jgi:hypothetical protein